MSIINKNPYSPLPSPKPNGGLDTGYQATGPWGALSCYYDASWLTRENLKSAGDNVPPTAFFQLQSGIRPGNNTYIPIPEVKRYDNDKLDIYCIQETCEKNDYLNGSMCSSSTKMAIR